MVVLRRTPLVSAHGIFVLVAALVVAVQWLVVTSSAFPEHADFLYLGVTLDLVIGLPFLGYILLVRSRRAPWWILLVLSIEGMVVAKLLLPAEGERFLHLAELLAPAAELALVGLLVLRARRLVRSYRSRRPRHLYRIDALEEALAEALGSEKTAGLVRTEIAVFDYALGGWWRRPIKSAPGRRVFAYHRRQGYPAVFATFAFLVVLETLVVHLVLSQWSPTVAWIVSAFGLIGLLWMLGDFQAMRHEPIVATLQTLEIRAGVRWRASIPWDRVKNVHRNRPDGVENQLSLLVFGEPDFWLELNEVVPVRGIYGVRRPVRVLGIGAEDAAGLRKLIEDELQSGEALRHSPKEEGPVTH